MEENFDPFHKWLGIPPREQPPNHYRLLGVVLFEADLEVIESAADRQMTHVRTFQSGRYSAQSQQVLNSLSAAKICLLKPEQKAKYDDSLRAQLAASKPAASLPPGASSHVAAPVVTPVVPFAAPTFSVQ